MKRWNTLMTTRTLVFILCLSFACSSEEKASYSDISTNYSLALSWTGTDYDAYMNHVRALKGAIKDHLAEYPSSKERGELNGYLQKLGELENSLIKEKSLYDRLISRRSESLTLNDIKKETQDINRFFESFPNALGRAELENRLSVLETLKADVLVQEMNDRLTDLYESMDMAARQKASEIHPMSNTTSFANTRNVTPVIEGEGVYNIQREYRIDMKGYLYGKFSLVISVSGTLEGFESKGVSYGVGNVSVLESN